jgi:hypothetical protein
MKCELIIQYIYSVTDYWFEIGYKKTQNIFYIESGYGIFLIDQSYHIGPEGTA